MNVERAGATVGAFLAELTIALLSACGSAIPLMVLWGWIMPPLFGLPAIGYFQALGMIIMALLMTKIWLTSASGKG